MTNDLIERLRRNHAMNGPTEITEEMLAAGRKLMPFSYSDSTLDDIMRRVYHAMLASAPPSAEREGNRPDRWYGPHYEWNEAIEAAAKVAEKHLVDGIAEHIAAAIRAQKKRTPSHDQSHNPAN